MRRVLLKLSGQAFGGTNGNNKFGIDTQVLNNISKQIADVKNVEIAIVVGGGNFFRGQELQSHGLNRERADYMGMLGTVINSLALQDFLEKKGRVVRTQTAITMGQIAEPYMPLKAIKTMKSGGIVIFGAGAGMPYFSTDTTSAQRALETHCDEVLIAKNGVDGVYSDDPNKNKNAKRFDKLTYDEALQKELTIIDAAAFSLCKENNLNMRIFGVESENSIKSALKGDNIGTIITN
jgi:uridylate kinase